MANPKLIIDNTFFSEWAKASFKNLTNTPANAQIIANSFKQHLDALKQNYNVVISDVVYNEASFGNSLRASAVTLLYTQNTKTLNGIPVVKTQTLDKVNAGQIPENQAGDHSIKELYDLYKTNGENVKVFSDDNRFYTGDYSVVKNNGDALTSSSIANQMLDKKQITGMDYNNVSSRLSPDTKQSFLSHETVIDKIVNFAKDTSGNLNMDAFDNLIGKVVKIGGVLDKGEVAFGIAVVGTLIAKGHNAQAAEYGTEMGVTALGGFAGGAIGVSLIQSGIAAIGIHPLGRIGISAIFIGAIIGSYYGSEFANDLYADLKAYYPNDGIGDILFGTKSLLNLSQKIFDPLVIDLGKDGITLISYEQSNAFVDLDNDGFKDHAGWVGKNASGVINDGLVFEDKNGNGKADGIAELVGGDDGTGNILGAFDELHQYYNTNDDLYFDSKDTKFNTMKLWVDSNGNGTSETSEVSLLKSKVRGIYIPLDVAPSGGYLDTISVKAPVFEAGNLITIESYVDLLESGESTTISNNFDFGDGAAKEIYFGTNTSFNAYTRPSNLTINQNALAMPNLRQSGANNTVGTPYWVAPLVDAMSMTTSQHGLNGAGILSHVQSMVTKSLNFNGDDFRADVQKLLLKWAGVEGITTDPRVHYNYINIPWMRAYEKFSGDALNSSAFVNFSTEETASKMINNLFEKLTDDVMMRLLPQVFVSWVQMNPDTAMETALSHPLKYFSVLHYDMEHDRVQGTLESAFEFLALDTATNETFYDQMYDNLGAFKFFLNQAFKGDSQEEIADKVSDIYDNLSVQSNPLTKDIFIGLFLTDKALRGTNANDVLTTTTQDGDLDHHIHAKNGNDTVTASKNDDTLIGGLGNDTLGGREGWDTYIYVKGDGQDIIVDPSFDGANDKLIVKGYNSTDATFQFMSKDDYYGYVKITFSATDSIEIDSVNDNNDIYYQTGLETVVFDDVTLTKQQIREKIISLQQTSGNDTVIGFTYVGDTIEGKKGNDTLKGREGSDTYIYTKGDGQDIIIDPYFDGANDKLIVNGYSSSQVQYVRLATDTYYSYIKLVFSSTDTIEIDSIDDTDYIYYQTGMETIQFSDKILTKNELREIVIANSQTSGNDIVRGFERDDDNLKGLAGNDTLYGFNGDDVLEGGTGADILDGDDHNDTAIYTNSTTGVNVNIATNSHSGGEAQGDSLISIENITGSSFNDIITGNDVSNIIKGDGGNDILEGGSGADNLQGGSGNDTATYANSAVRVRVNLDTNQNLEGDAEGDILTAIENITGSAFHDILYADDYANILKGLDGNDFFYGSVGADSIDGGNGADTLSYYYSLEAVNVNLATNVVSGGDAQGDILTSIMHVRGSNIGGDIIKGDASNNALYGYGGNDYLYGGLGADSILGGAGSDKIFAEGGNDSLKGEDGNDTFYLLGGIETVDGGVGTDAVTYYSSLAGITASLATGGISGDATGDDYTNVEILYGTKYNDTLYGSDNNDTLYGYSGNDSLEGGLGADTLNGSTDADKFIYGATADSTNTQTDSIMNFEESDIIQISNTIASNIAGLTLSNSEGYVIVDDVNSDFYLKVETTNLTNSNFAFAA